MTTAKLTRKERYAVKADKVAAVDEIPIRIPKISREILEERVRRSWTKGNFPDSHMDRLTVNYLRHECTPYDEGIKMSKGRVGYPAQRVLRSRVLNAISDAFPHLYDECERQKDKYDH